MYLFYQPPLTNFRWKNSEHSLLPRKRGKLREGALVDHLLRPARLPAANRSGLLDRCPGDHERKGSAGGSAGAVWVKGRGWVNLFDGGTL